MNTAARGIAPYRHGLKARKAASPLVSSDFGVELGGQPTFHIRPPNLSQTTDRRQNRQPLTGREKGQVR